jgi:hypothetical protein
VRVQGNLLLLIDAATKKSYTAVIRIERLPKPASFTAAQGRNVDGVQRVESIVFQGSDDKTSRPVFARVCELPRHGEPSGFASVSYRLSVCVRSDRRRMAMLSLRAVRA